jgi:hypothetical protein
MTARNTFAMLTRQLQALEASVAWLTERHPPALYRIRGGLVAEGSSIAFHTVDSATYRRDEGESPGEFATRLAGLLEGGALIVGSLPDLPLADDDLPLQWKVSLAEPRPTESLETSLSQKGRSESWCFSEVPSAKDAATSVSVEDADCRATGDGQAAFSPPGDAEA